MKRTLSLITLCVAGGALATSSCGGDDGGDDRAAAARPGPSAPVEITLRPKHRSGVTGTATLVPDGANLKVAVALDKRVPGSLLAHIHSGPCSHEPTWSNPRIWASLTEVIDGRSETTVNVVTLQELQSESSSINVHDPTHNQRPLVCGDIPRAN